MAIQSDYKFLLSEKHPSYAGKFLSNPLRDEATLDGRKIFKTSHDEVVKQWKDSDYRLIVTKGVCDRCVLDWYAHHTDCEIITQEGSHHLGQINVGFCFTCTSLYCENREFEKLQMTIPFEGSSDKHQVAITVDKLQDLLERREPFYESFQSEGKPLSETQVGCLKYIVEHNGVLIEQANREREKPYQCKQCRKITTKKESVLGLQVNEQNSARKAHRIQGLCLGCSLPMRIQEGCSMSTCEQCISRTKTCLVCLNGATNLEHDLEKCSQLMKKVLIGDADLPEIRICKCEEQ